MSIEIYGWDELLPEDKELIASSVESFTNGNTGEKPQMLPVTKQGVYNKFLAAVALSEGEFMGYVAADTPLRYNETTMVEIGSLWVPSQQRKRGIARSLVSYLTLAVEQEDITPFAFCNQSSIDVFLGSGYNRAMPEDIPPVAYGLCSECPLKPDTGCCDTTVIYCRDNDE
ncbi:GNAT family N-acetyltransferase [Candidatus Saccharibacteria bacterium]|jgi:N-acetylglutamate synthase-like GNAT family acetyltransferase|nr:GNAT family N-acetyltransferase [Candidatus Saccharibacteria bacterium]